VATETRYQYLEINTGIRSKELFVMGTGIRASTIWHDRYVSRLSPTQIAEDRDIPPGAVYEALAYCQENWEAICDERDAEASELHQRGFLTKNPA